MKKKTKETTELESVMHLAIALMIGAIVIGAIQTWTKVI